MHYYATAGLDHQQDDRQNDAKRWGKWSQRTESFHKYVRLFDHPRDWLCSVQHSSCCTRSLCLLGIPPLSSSCTLMMGPHLVVFSQELRRRILKFNLFSILYLSNKVVKRMHQNIQQHPHHMLHYLWPRIFRCVSSCLGLGFFVSPFFSPWHTPVIAVKQTLTSPRELCLLCDVSTWLVLLQ